MNDEAKRFPLLTRLAAYSGSSLQFAVFASYQGEPVLSTTTAIHQLPVDKMLSEVADHIHQVLIERAYANWELPEGIEWERLVIPGVCTN